MFPQMARDIVRNETFLTINYDSIRYENSHVRLELRYRNIRFDTRFYIFVTRFDLPNSQ